MTDGAGFIFLFFVSDSVLICWNLKVRFIRLFHKIDDFLRDYRCIL